MDKDLNPIYDFIKEYISTGYLRLHMPGHKGKEISEDHLLQHGIYEADITEIPGADDLHNPTGIIAESQKNIASIFGANASFFLINGATAGILASFLSTLKPGKKVVVPRNSHKSVLSALILTGAIPQYLPLEYNGEYGFPLGIDKKYLTKDILKITVKFNVRPTYQGVVDDLLPSTGKSIQIVDEAHGGHLRFSKDLPDDALSIGGDLVIQGTHKTLGSLTQTGLLHVSKKIDRHQIRQALSIVQSTSPSYILLLSLERMGANLAKNGERLINRCVELANYIRNKINKINDFSCLTEKDVYPRKLDATKIVFSYKRLSGYQLADLLCKEYQIQVEAASDRHVIAMVTFNDTYDSLKRLIKSLEDISQRYRSSRVIGKGMIYSVKIPPLKILPREALFAAKRQVRIEEAKGLVCAESFCPYPPGIPIIYPGELITEEVIDYINYVKKIGAHWQGCTDPSLKTIQVVD